MPVYEYQCAKCREKFEAYVKRDDEKVPCPKCRAKKVKKLFSVFGIGMPGGGHGAPALSERRESKGG
jgi:putative FmdB family regulatory protein